VHGRGFESLILGVNGGECMVQGSNLGLFGGQLWCNDHPQNQQSKPSRPPGLFIPYPAGRHGLMGGRNIHRSADIDQISVQYDTWLGPTVKGHETHKSLCATS
jgi:hypothetical protein